MAKPVIWEGPEDLRPLLAPIGKLRPDPRNARRHGAKNLESIVASLSRFGQTKPIVVQREGATVRAGNGTLDAAKVIGWTHVAVSWVDFDDARSAAYAIADNRTAELAEWDDAMLADVLSADVPIDLLDATGFTEREINRMVNAAVDLAEEDDEDGEERTEAPLPAAPKDPVSRPGDVWILGPHRLLVGDSTRTDEVLEFLGEERLDMVFTDPPFAIYGSSTGVDQSVADGGMVVPFFRDVGRICRAATREFAHVYVCCDWRSFPILASEIGDLLRPANLIVWRKPGGSALGSFYWNRHELVGLWIHEPKTRSMFSRKKKNRASTVTKTTGKHRTILDENVWEAKVVPVQKRDHFAQKPLENVERAIRNSTDRGDLVGDFFGGSGTTLVAAGNLGRRARLVEKNPSNADVIVARWERETGEKAERRSSDV